MKTKKTTTFRKVVIWKSMAMTLRPKGLASMAVMAVPIMVVAESAKNRRRKTIM